MKINNRFRRTRQALSILSLLCAFGAQAGAPEITRDERYVYVRTPYNLAYDDEVERAIQEHLELLHQELEKLLPENQVTRKALEKLEEQYPKIDDVLEFLRDHSASYDEEAFHWHEAIPSAYLVYAGGKFTANLKIGGGGSVSIGLIFRPVNVVRHDMVTKQVDTYREWDSFLIALPNINFGGGIGGGPRFRFGAGVIWGDLKNLSDFVGPVGAVSGTVVVGAGVNYKIGALNQLGQGDFIDNPFLIAGVELGAAATIEPHGNIAYVVGLSKLVEALSNETPADGSKPEAVTEAIP